LIYLWESVPQILPHGLLLRQGPCRIEIGTGCPTKPLKAAESPPAVGAHSCAPLLPCGQRRLQPVTARRPER